MNQDREKIREEFIKYRTTISRAAEILSFPKLTTDEEIADWFLNKMALRDADTLQKVEERLNRLFSQKYEGIDRINPKLESMIMYCVSEKYDDSPKELPAIRTMNNQE